MGESKVFVIIAEGEIKSSPAPDKYETGLRVLP